MRSRLLRQRNRDAVIHEIASREDRVDTYPFEIQFSGEHRCNLRCIQCGATIERNQGLVPLMDERLPLRSLERFRKLEPQIPDLEWLSLTGSGETLINPDLPGILAVLGDVDHDCTVAFNTNGTLWTRDRARLVVESGVDEIRFSMDGATKETFEAIRVNAKFEKVLDGIRTLRSVRDELGAATPKISFSCNFMRRNIEELPQLVELAHAEGAVDLIANNTIVYAPEMEGEALSKWRPLVVRMLRAAQERADALGIHVVNNLLSDEELAAAPAADTPAEAPSPRMVTGDEPIARVEPITAGPPTSADATPRIEPIESGPSEDAPCAEPGNGDAESLAESILPPLEDLPDDLPEIVHACQRPWTGLYVENNGYVKVCCFDVQPIGNLDEQSFGEIWNGPLARELRRSFLEDRPPEGCRNCFIFAAGRADDDVFVRPSGAMRCHIDAPGLDPRVSGTTTVHGWALDREGVDRVELSVDGEFFAVAVYGHERPDVEQAFPGYPDGGRCGFRFDLDTTRLTVGEHLLAITVHNRAGDVGEGPTRAILVAR